MRETAFAVATDLALADGEIAKQEKDILTKIQMGLEYLRGQGGQHHRGHADQEQRLTKPASINNGRTTKVRLFSFLDPIISSILHQLYG